MQFVDSIVSGWIKRLSKGLSQMCIMLSAKLKIKILPNLKVWLEKELCNKSGMLLFPLI